MKREYKGVIWTDHALERLRQRGISQSDAWYAFRRPDQSRYAKAKDAWIYYKQFEDQMIEVVAKKEDSNWIVLSVWSKKIKNKKQNTNKQPLLKRILSFFS